MILISLFVVFSLSLVALDSVPEQDECGGPLSTFEFDDIIDGCNYYARCTHPTYKLNANCIRTSCPSLENVCPINSNGSINNEALNSAVSILNTCIGQEGLICGIKMSHIPMVQMGGTTKNLLPTNVVNGTFNLNPGSGFLDNLSEATFTLMEIDNPVGSVSLYIRAPNITTKSYFTGTFNLTEDSFLLPLKIKLITTNVPNSLTTPNVLGTYNNDVSCLISIDLSAYTPNITIIHDQSNIVGGFYNFVSSDKFELPQTLADLLNQGIQKFVEKSDISSTTIIFLSTFMAHGLQAAQFNCP